MHTVGSDGVNAWSESGEIRDQRSDLTVAILIEYVRVGVYPVLESMGYESEGPCSRSYLPSLVLHRMYHVQ